MTRKPRLWYVSRGLLLAWALWFLSSHQGAVAQSPSVEDRLAALEQKTQDIHRGSYHDVAKNVDIPTLQVNARVGLFTNYWMNQPIGQGAALSVGTGIDRFAGYFEIDDETSPDHPSVAVYGAVVARSLYGQPHIALEGVAGNAPDAKGISQNYGLALSLNDRQILLQREGMQLRGDFSNFLMGRIDGRIKQVWP